LLYNSKTPLFLPTHAQIAFTSLTQSFFVSKLL